MSELQFYYIILFSFLGLGVITFFILFFITAPYGRYAKKGWGPLINNRVGWVLQESPASLMIFFYFFFDSRPFNITLVALLIIWQAHYFHRAFIYPFTIRSSNRVPLLPVIMAILFNIVNSYIQGRWIFKLAPDAMYTSAWLTDPRFIAGVLIFSAGYFINKQSDHILRNLRAPGESGYKIPRGGLFDYVSSPNYFGEILTWTGWAIATWSLAGLYFLIWTIANLGPRARSHHNWYKATFPDYPAERKIIIPYIL